MKKEVIKILNKLPYIRGLYKENLELKGCSLFPHGHFYSPVISINEIEEQADRIWKKKGVEAILGIDFHVGEQLELLRSLKSYYPELPYLDSSFEGRYRFDNNYFFYCDGVILYSILRHFKPHRIIEIGSGHSSALMLDVNEIFFKSKITFEFIEPNPERLYGLLEENDTKANTIIPNEVQEVPLDIYKKLQANDILFIDSSHVIKTGSDVNFVFSEVLPVLKPGVLIHFHDIFYPFEYPKDWVYQKLNWNEVYFLRSFLSYNDKIKMIFFTHFLQEIYPTVFEKVPLCNRSRGSSLWLIKM